MPSRRYIYTLVLLALTTCAAAEQIPPSQPVTAASELAQQILTRGPVSTAAVSFQNMSTMTPEMQEAAQNTIFSSLRNAGVRLVNPGGAAMEVQIIFSDDWQGYLWIAVIHQGSATQTLMKRLPRPERTAASHAPSLTLHKTSVWQQEGPILDFFSDGQTLVLLEPEQISLYANDSGQWRTRYTLAIAHDQPWPRDLRGRLKMNGGQIAAFLPGIVCTGMLSPPALECHQGDDPWPLDDDRVVAFYSARRNFFSGILSGAGAGASVAPFFSAAAWTSGDQRQWLFASTDGRALLFQNDLSSPAAVFNAWGSNVVAIHSGCGSGWQVLATSPADTIHPDSLQAVEIAGREAQPVSSPIDLPGPISALWSAGKNGETANAVMQLPDTGKYEAFALTVTCN